MARLAFKPDSSFFDKIVRGAIGTRAVCADLEQYGHRLVELERGSLDTKLWKDVKRKRVRIPDLLCTSCGMRIESRAKSKPEITMSHSETDTERTWDFGMVDTDLVAFPVCGSDTLFWGVGTLTGSSSYWHERNRSRWRVLGRINYFTVKGLRAAPFAKKSTKGVTEGSETLISWPATFAKRDSLVESVESAKVRIRRTHDGRRQTLKIPANCRTVVVQGESVREMQVVASAVQPTTGNLLECTGRIRPGRIPALLRSRERTQRFTGVRLARLLRDATHTDLVRELAQDEEEDVYIRLEGIAYLSSVAGESASSLFGPFLASSDPQTQLETVIAIGETSTDETVELLSNILDRHEHPYFLRSAAAWCLGQIGGERATEKLIRLFSDVDVKLREEALARIVSIGQTTVPILVERIGATSEDTSAGCAEALRQLQPLPADIVDQLVSRLQGFDHSTIWATWLLGNLPRMQVGPKIAELQSSAPQLHFALSVLWSFVESWIARGWELCPGPGSDNVEDMDVV